jgi:hypothetical protein
VLGDVAHHRPRADPGRRPPRHPDLHGGPSTGLVRPDGADRRPRRETGGPATQAVGGRAAGFDGAKMGPNHRTRYSRPPNSVVQDHFVPAEVHLCKPKVRLKSGRSPVRSRPWPPTFLQFKRGFRLCRPLRISESDSPMGRAANPNPPGVNVDSFDVQSGQLTKPQAAISQDQHHVALGPTGIR